MLRSYSTPYSGTDLRVGAQLRLLDFEFGDFRHALADGIFGGMFFPICECCNRVPQPVVTQMEATYRTMLMQACPPAR